MNLKAKGQKPTAKAVTKMYEIGLSRVSVKNLYSDLKIIKHEIQKIWKNQLAGE